MRRGQILLLVMMAIIAIILLSTAVIWALTLVNSEPSEAVGAIEESEIAMGLSPTPTSTATPTPTDTPVFTATPTPTDTPIPTETPTRVVNDTATPTPSKTPLPTAIPTNTPPSASSSGGGSSSSGGSSTRTGPQPTPTPTSRYPFKIVEGPVAYETDNHFLVVLAKLTKNNTLLANYRLAGFHSPTGLNWRSVPSCGHLCKASGPGKVINADGEVIANTPIQEGNLFFEFPYYEKGFWALMVLDPQGYQVSEAFYIEFTGGEDDRKWYYIQFHSN